MKVIKNAAKILFLSLLTASVSSALANNADAQTQQNQKSFMQGTKQEVDDSVITTKIKALFLSKKLFGDESVDPTITVETKQGVVYLNGTVKDPEQMKTAIDLAKSVKGVKKVSPAITVKSDKD